MAHTSKIPEFPIGVRVPLFTSVFMLAVSFIVTNTVLSRLAQTQERHLQKLSLAYVDGLSASLVPHILREDIWEVFDTLDRSRSVYTGLNALNTVVLSSDDMVIAASDPAAFPTAEAVNPAILRDIAVGGQLTIDETSETARLLRQVKVQGQHIGSVYADLDISALLAERRSVLWQLIVTNVFLTIALTCAAYFLVRRMVEPVRTLGDYLERGGGGSMEIIPPHQLQSATGEFRRLFERYNVMARAANDRLELAAQLAKEERLASLGRLASGMAHEINNPLGGLFNALDSLKRYGNRAEVRASSIRLIESGLGGIREVVRAMLMSYRQKNDPGFLRPQDIDDLRYLIKPSLRQKQLKIEWSNEIGSEIRVWRQHIRDAALNLLLNACAASPIGGTIHFRTSILDNSVKLQVWDEGEGMPEPYRAFLEARGTSRTPLKPGGGLGLWMVRRLLDEVNGTASVETGGDGTTIRLTIPVASEDARNVA